MAKRILVKLTTPSDTKGTIRAVIEAASVQRMGESTSDSPAIPAQSPPLVIDTSTPIEPVWDVPDELVIAGEEVELGLQFANDVRLPDGRELEQDPQAWLRLQGIEIPFEDITIEAIPDTDTSFALRMVNAPTERVANSTEFTVIIRTTLSQKLSKDPTINAITVTPATARVVSICTIICRESYGFAIRTPATGGGDITITAVNSEWEISSGVSIIGTDTVSWKVGYGELTGVPTATIDMESFVGPEMPIPTLRFRVTWSSGVSGSTFSPDDISIDTNRCDVTAGPPSVSETSTGVYTVESRITNALAVDQTETVEFTARIRAGVVSGTAEVIETFEQSFSGPSSARATGFQPMIVSPALTGSGTALPSNADGEIRTMGPEPRQDYITESTFIVPITWTETEAQTQAASEFCSGDLVGSFRVGGVDKSDNAIISIDSLTRVGTTNTWHATITVTETAPPTGDTPGVVRVTVNEGALSPTATRNRSRANHHDYAYQITVATGYQPTLGTALSDGGSALPSDANGSSGNPIMISGDTTTRFIAPITWSGDAADQAAREFCSSHISANFQIAGMNRTDVASVSVISADRVGQTDVWRALIAVDPNAPASGTTTAGVVSVVVQAAALSGTTTRDPSLEGSNDYHFSITG